MAERIGFTRDDSDNIDKRKPSASPRAFGYLGMTRVLMSC